jgi:16S rRNA (guanine966-N2)-methyltransferase
MRIISGKARGIQLRVPAGRGVRPTADRVKESLFGMLGDLTGAHVVDLFAGTGALGLEAVSRGAASALFVEQNRANLQILESNLAAVRKCLGPDFPANVRVICCDVLTVPRRLPELGGTFTVAFADPPYSPRPGNTGPAEVLSDAGLPAWLGSALLVLEHPAKCSLPWHPLSAWKAERSRSYGTTEITFARRAEG